MILTYLFLQSTFRYDSSLETSKITYHDYSYGRDGGLDNRQYKGGQLTGELRLKKFVLV